MIIKKYQLVEAFQILKDLNEQMLPATSALRVAEVIRVTDQVALEMRQREAEISAEATQEMRDKILSEMMEDDVFIDTLPIRAEQMSEIKLSPKSMAKITWLVKE